MPPFTTRLANGWDDALTHPSLALVPLVTALLATEKITRIAGFHGRHLGLRLGLPVGVVDLWQFVSVPNETASVGPPIPEAVPLAVVVVPLVIVIQSGLAAGYFGSLERAVSGGDFDFGRNVRRYIRPFLLYTLVPMAVVLPVALLEVAGRRALLPVTVLLVPAFIVAAYLFYAIPYLVVLRDEGLVSAARRSYALATEGGPYLRFAVGYAGFVIGLSLLVTAVVVNLGLVGVAIGVAVLAPVGVACNATAMRFVADIDDGQAPESAGRAPSVAEP